MGYNGHKQPVYLGDRIKVRTIRGFKGNVIGLLPDGRTIIFDRDSPFLSMLGPGQLVECKVIHVSGRYVIVDPIREPEPLEREGRPMSEKEPRERVKPPEIDKAKLLEDLRRLSEEGEWEKAIIAGALMHIIEKLDASREPPTSSLTSSVDHPPDPPLSDELRRAASSFGLTQPEVREQKEPKPGFLRYLDGHREEETIGDREVEGMGDDVPISITLEAFGQVIGLPWTFGC
jgi:hypothetical protein